MNLFVTLIILFIFGQAAWSSILKRGVYPLSVKWYLKWFHAFTLYFMLIYALCAFSELLWLINYRSELIDCFHSHSKVILGPVTGVTHIVSCASGLTLPFICDQMAKRRREVLRWFFVVWPINFLSVVYIIITSTSGKYPTWSIALLIVMLCGIFLASILFYLNASVINALFKLQPKA
jgi:hypothetical protein